MQIYLFSSGQDNSVTPSKRRLAIRALTDLLFQLQTPVMGSQILDDFSICLVLTI